MTILHIELPGLKNLRDVFEEAVIFGSGPTSIDYEAELPKITMPIFFINAAHKFSDICTSQHKYFFTHHLSKYTTVSPTTVFIKRMFMEDDDNYRGVLKCTVVPKNKYIAIDAQGNDEVVTERFLDHFRLRNKDEVARKNRLLACFGSATTAIHFAWFTGCKKVTFIGCNPHSDTNAYDPRIAQGSMAFSPYKVKQNNKILPNFLGLEVEYL